MLKLTNGMFGIEDYLTLSGLVWGWPSSQGFHPWLLYFTPVGVEEIRLRIEEFWVMTGSQICLPEGRYLPCLSHGIILPPPQAQTLINL
jgi:hypothetical protein